MRKTKIICTIGPASESKEVLTKMCEAGMNVARLNFSHGTHEEHQKKIDTIKEVRESLNMPIAIMLDTKGQSIELRHSRMKRLLLKQESNLFLLLMMLRVMKLECLLVTRIW